MGNGMSKVVDGLYLGNIRDSEDRESLAKHGITHILSVYNNAKPVMEDMTYLCIQAADSSNQNFFVDKRPSKLKQTLMKYRISDHDLAIDTGQHKQTQALLPNYTVYSFGCCIEYKDVMQLCVRTLAKIQHFKECISFIHECRLSGGSCLVHCLAGVSRSTTVVVAYLMTVTSYSWEECLSAVKAVRSFVGPNFGFQQQLQEFQMTLVPEFRSWLRAKYSHSPSDDQEGVRKLLGLYEEQQQQRQRNGEQSWMNQAASVYPLPYNAYGRSGHSSTPPGLIDSFPSGQYL